MPAASSPLPSPKAKRLILAGEAPPNLSVSGHLHISNPSLRELPTGLSVHSLTLTGCGEIASLPADLKVQSLQLTDCPALTELPPNLHCRTLVFRNSRLRRLPLGLSVQHLLDLEGSARLEELPERLSVQVLRLRGCVSLAALTASLLVQDLDLSGCTGLCEWPGPTNLRLQQLNIANCRQLRALPEGLRVDGVVEMASTGLAGIPTSLTNTILRWRGVTVSERILFRPHTLNAATVLNEPNAEVRRIMIERVGYERLFAECQPVVLDRDQDAGGERVLRRIALPSDEDLTCLSVKCPSTGRQYVLRVPPRTASCRQAAAWIAGYDNPDHYQPIVET